MNTLRCQFEIENYLQLVSLKKEKIIEWSCYKFFKPKYIKVVKDYFHLCANQKEELADSIIEDIDPKLLEEDE